MSNDALQTGQEKQKVKLHKASKALMVKAGSGEISSDAIKSAEKTLENNTVDFSPMAKQCLDEIRQVIEEAKKEGSDLNIMRASFTKPFMELKGSAKPFHYELVGDLANIMLTLLEEAEKIDDDIISLIEVQHKALSMIISKKISGDGGQIGSAMRKELHAAFERYVKKTRP